MALKTIRWATNHAAKYVLTPMVTQFCPKPSFLTSLRVKVAPVTNNIGSTQHAK